ncbi:MAG: ferritin family protein, partial [Planctomycetota bacterium]
MGEMMDYISRYNLIAKAMLNFEKTACDFYLTLASHSKLQTISCLMRQLASEKSKELDIFAGMITVSDFLLKDFGGRHYKSDETDNWLSGNIPPLYDEGYAACIIEASTARKSLAVIVEMEKIVLHFYRALRKKIPMNTGQIDS